jgi:hypothetical protein
MASPEMARAVAPLFAAGVDHRANTDTGTDHGLPNARPNDRRPARPGGLPLAHFAIGRTRDKEAHR